ncbi:MAG: hypothetical protein A2Z72_02450 [Omnitrophica bacterium RBG_13_46_9]|nr:MAG: hypothetical protein A2Z72_02450 [Omnitrophica bacterium RBG_13_46_9]
MTDLSSYSLSTAWNYRKHRDAKGMADEIKSLGFDSVELNFALTESQVNDFVKLRDSGYIKISSTHNFCPLPNGAEPSIASPEYYSLSSLEDNERSLAVKFTKRSMDIAKRLGAPALVLHLGSLRIKDRTTKLFTALNRSELEKAKREALHERTMQAKPFLDKAKESLEDLLRYAERIDLSIALENRYYIRELPSLEEFKIIFELFDSKHLGYWHDTGHAQIYENLYIHKHEDYLEALSNNLIGVHLHDIIMFDDHRAPGCGEFDFKRLRPYLKPGTIKVIEAHRKVAAGEIKVSLSYLKRVL